MYDDIKDDLASSVKGEELKKKMPILELIHGKNPSISDITRPLEPHETDLHCIKSIYYKPPSRSNENRPSFFFKSQGRKETLPPKEPPLPDEQAQPEVKETRKTDPKKPKPKTDRQQDQDEILKRTLRILLHDENQIIKS